MCKYKNNNDIISIHKVNQIFKFQSMPEIRI